MITEIAQIDVKPGTEKEFEAAVAKARPATAKGAFIENVTLSATMLPGMRVDATPFLKL